MMTSATIYYKMHLFTIYDLTTHPGLSKFIIKLIVTFSGVKLLVEGKNKQLLAPQ